MLTARLRQLLVDLDLAGSAVGFAHWRDQGPDRSTDGLVQFQRLICHQRYQRTNNDGDARERKRRKLEDVALPVAGGQDGEKIPASSDVPQRFLLLVFQLHVVAELESPEHCRASLEQLGLEAPLLAGLGFGLGGHHGVANEPELW